MSLNLPAQVHLPTSPDKRDLAIAQITIFSAILQVNFILRSRQTWLYWNSTRWQRTPARCILRGFYNFVNIVSIIRIIGNSLYLALDKPKGTNRATAITIVVLQGVGVVPLVVSWTYLVLRCGRPTSPSDSQSLWPTPQRLTLQWSRLLFILVLIMIIVSANTLNLTVYKAAAILFVCTFIMNAGIALWLANHRRHVLTEAGRKALWVALGALPFLFVRVAFLMMVEFGSVKFSPVLGDWRYQAGMGFAMEVGVMGLLIIGRLVQQPLKSPSVADQEMVGEDDDAFVSEGVTVRTKDS